MKQILLPILVAAAFVAAPATTYSADKDRRQRDRGGRTQINRAVRADHSNARIHRNYGNLRRSNVNYRQGNRSFRTYAGNRNRSNYGNRSWNRSNWGNRGYYRDGSYYRDLDGDGHYNRKEYDNDRRYRSYGRGYYPSSYRYPYYGSGYGRGYGYGGYGYGYGYGSGYGYGYPYYGTSLAVSYYAQPTYAYRGSYRGYQADYGDSLAADVQRALQRRGYYRGYVDGEIGPRSRAAIRAYQADHRLTPTGRIDSRLLRSLDIG